MPLHDVGFRKWDGFRTPQWMRWRIIAETGIRIAIKSAWVRRIVFFCWLPILYWGVGLFVFERLFAERNLDVIDLRNGRQVAEGSEIPSEFSEELAQETFQRATRQLRQKVQETGDEAAAAAAQQVLKDNFGGFPAVDDLITALEENDAEATRHIVWKWMLMTYFKYPQNVALVLLLGIIAPSLISRDIRSRALLLYFSRPIDRIDYIFGKMMVPTAFLVFVTTVPAIVLYILAISLSVDFSVVLATWDIPFRILFSTLVVVIPTVSLALMLSALTQESRFAAFAWFAVWALGQGAWFAVLISTSIERGMEPFSAAKLDEIRRFSGISLFNNLGSVQSWIFGFESFGDVWINLLILVVLTAFSLFVLFRSVSKAVHV